MKARIKWIEGVSFVAESGSGHAVVLDGSPDHGGRNLGMRPMEAVLIGLGSCSAFDVVTILRKSRQKVTSCHVELDAERADSIPAVFTKIHMHYVVRGHALKPAAVQRAVKLSVDTYCSATAMLKPHVE
ncbi:MAG: putative redox protein, partial [Gammaproteobacteria bacterium]